MKIKMSQCIGQQWPPHQNKYKKSIASKWTSSKGWNMIYATAMCKRSLLSGLPPYFKTPGTAVLMCSIPEILMTFIAGIINKVGGPWETTVANKHFLSVHLLDKWKNQIVNEHFVLLCNINYRSLLYFILDVINIY